MPPSRVQHDFTTFATDHWHRSVNFTFRLMGGSREAAEDITQNAFLQAHRALNNYRGDAKLSTWFYPILLRQISSHRRRERSRRRRSVLAGDLVAHTHRRPAPLLREDLLRAVGTLSKRQRQVFELTYLNGRTLLQSATLLNCSVGTVKSHLHRALRKLRTDLSNGHPRL